MADEPENLQPDVRSPLDDNLPESAGDPQRFLDIILSNVVKTVGGRAGIMRLWDRRRRRASTTSSYGLSQEILKEIEPLIDRSLPELEATVTASGQALVPVAAEQGSTTWRVEPLGNHVKASLGPLHLISLPLRKGDELVGMLCLFHPSAVPELLADHPGITEIILNQVDVVIQNARLLERLWEEKRWLETIIQNSADGIIIVDRQCRIMGFNRAMTRFTGYRVNEALGRFCHEIFPLRTNTGEDYCAAICPLRHGDTDRPPLTEAILTDRQGHSLPVEVTFAALKDEEGLPLGGVIEARDIRARKEAEQLQSTFLSVISHELQTPIAIIRGYADLLRDEGQQLPPEQVQEKLSFIVEESDRLSKMVENLLYASRIQAGGLKLNREPVALGPLAQRVVQRLSSLSAKHILRVEMPDPLPAVLADYERIEEVLVNLVENAIKYSPQGGEVVISAEVTSNEVIVSVADQGIGIPPEERERIFERFSRLDSRLVRQMKGTGLGLFICKSIVEAHGGRIWAEAAPGGGSRFRFTLPREQKAQLPALVNYS